MSDEFKLGHTGADPRGHGLFSCAECRTPRSLFAWGWRAYRVDVPGDDPEPELAFYCPTCAAREFGKSKAV